MSKLVQFLAGHRKAAAAVAGVILTAAQYQWGPGNKWVSLAILAASALGVYAFPNSAPPAAGKPGR